MAAWKLHQRLAFSVAYLLCRLLHGSYRYRWYGLENYQAAALTSPRQNPVLACWHQNTLPCVLAHAHRKLAVIVSKSFDGELIASVAERFGIAGARGSSSRGGTEALRAALKFARQGLELGITVDGPRGPRHEIKPGVFFIASRTGCSILPLAAVGRRSWTLTKSWDKFQIPKPFTTVDCLYGKPFSIPSQLDDATLQHYSENLKISLLELEAKLQEWSRLRGWPMTETKES